MERRNGAAIWAWARLVVAGRRLVARLVPLNLLVGASILLALGICCLVGLLLLQARREAWEHAGREATNLRRVVARDLDRNLELIDLSLRAVTENMLVPGVASLPVDILSLVLFDRVVSASHIGAVIVTDANGRMVMASRPGPWPELNFADREYFHEHRDGPFRGMIVGRPVEARLSGSESITFSRRRNNPDGSFAGVAAVSVQVAYFRNLLTGLNIGPDAALSIHRDDGLLLTRVPEGSVALGQDMGRTEPVARAMAGEREPFTSAALDGVNRLYAGSQVGHHPMLVLVGMSTDQLDAVWRHKALIEGIATLALAGGMMALTLVWRRNLGRRMAAEAAAQASEASFRMLAENSADMVTRLSLDLTRLYASPAALRVMGRRPEEVIGHRTVQHIHPADRAGVEAAMARLRDGGAEETSVIYRVLRPGAPLGDEPWVEGTVRLTRDSITGAPDGYVAVTRDISERHRLEEEREVRRRELAKARDAAEAASRAKSRFLSSMSHELRTPLNVILGFTQVLSLDPGLRESQKQQIDAMQAAGRHLLEMISGILDFSRIEAGQVDLNPSLVVLQPLAAQCLALVRADATAKHLDLSLAVAADAPATATLDPLRLRQILINLLGNAVKFTARGSVTLRLLTGGPGRLRLEVADTGPGIPAGQRGRLFQDFERLGNATAGSVEGSGLGLAISWRLAALLGGRMGHAENPGGGSIFWLEVPTAAA